MRVIVAAAALAFTLSAAHAADTVSSALSQPGAALSHSTVRLVDGGARDGMLRAGVDIRLAPGWKTYWRVPGDSGVPPVFDWSGSQNVAEAAVRWPAPVRFSDAFGENIGYKDRVVFPVEVMPADPAKPVRLDLTLDYAVCREVCVPARAELSADLGEGWTNPQARALVESYAETVPKPAGEVPGLEIGAVRAVTDASGGKGVALEIEIESDTPSVPADILVEGDGTVYFGVPRRLDSGAGESGSALRYLVPVDGATDAVALAGQPLRITVLQGGKRLADSRQVE
ncbi:hypothetical protein HW532_05070 [Kaustia mangrovi]|uniref:Thiol:disulfide interchange protein DsbD N-terminal domain-containing protein n=1 Tax=Kaustia mangrovi TaxID=2593653 RepID=A0A7S8C2I6_9HYPH|nr:protein-disulfide reductase DsbD domain-containing protein [Kaustia mangrovi]QPC42127.1 hypothetical protein HW532_05070 [Kaustia mangrovi]